MKKIIVFLLVGVLVYSCTNNSNVTIKGKLDNTKGQYIYLQELMVNGDGMIDSLLPDESGSFKFKRKIVNPSFFTLRAGNSNKLITLLAIPGERIKIKGKADSLLQTYSVAGSEESKKVQLITQRLNKTINILDSLNGVYQRFLTNPNIENIQKVLTTSYNNCYEEQRKFSIAFIEANPTSLACLLALYQQLKDKVFVFSQEEDLKYFRKVDSVLFKKYRDMPHVKALHANIEEMKQQKKVLEMRRMLSIMGAKAPEIALPSPRGDTVRLTSLKGKIVLLDFWASWCKPCRDMNPNLVKLYNKYKNKKFEIFQVSLDKTKDDWIKAIRTDGLWWTQVSDLKYWQSPVVKLYNFEEIPTSYLIDKDGSIIAKDLKGEALDNRLAEILGEKSSATGK